jgi:hypothetical protein
MFEDDRDAWPVTRGLADALACQDLLARVPSPPGPITRVRAWVARVIVNVTRPDPNQMRRPIPPAADLRPLDH